MMERNGRWFFSRQRLTGTGFILVECRWVGFPLDGQGGKGGAIHCRVWFCLMLYLLLLEKNKKQQQQKKKSKERKGRNG
jgi:hypothetical protein